MKVFITSMVLLAPGFYGVAQADSQFQKLESTFNSASAMHTHQLPTPSDFSQWHCEGFRANTPEGQVFPLNAPILLGEETRLLMFPKSIEDAQFENIDESSRDHHIRLLTSPELVQTADAAGRGKVSITLRMKEGSIVIKIADPNTVEYGVCRKNI